MIKQILKFFVWLIILFILACIIISFNKPKIELPTLVIIGGETYRVVHEVMKQNALGMTESFLHKITINTAIPMDKGTETEVLVHEMLHAANRRIKIEKILENDKINNYDKEELIVSALAPYFVEIYRDNDIPIK